MVSMRCRDRIAEELNKWGIMIPEISQGILEFQEEPDGLQMLQLKEGLFDLGFEVLDEVETNLLDQISEMINELICEKTEIELVDYPDYVRRQLGFDDSEIMLVFSLVHGVDLLQYATIQQVERIKELILYEGRKPGEIVKLLHFKDAAQLNRIFQKITGLKPSYYEEIREKRLEVQRRMASVNTDRTNVRLKETN